jgi:hypothetical protein
MPRHENGFPKVSTMRVLLPAAIALVLACAGRAEAQANQAQEQAKPAASPPFATTRTMASLLAEGYEPQTVQIFKDKIWMRKGFSDGIAFVCDRGRIGSPAFDAYREKKYDQISCSLAQ